MIWKVMGVLFSLFYIAPFLLNKSLFYFEDVFLSLNGFSHSLVNNISALGTTTLYGFVYISIMAFILKLKKKIKQLILYTTIFVSLFLVVRTAIGL